MSRQHFIPQFYQRGWTTQGSGLIWVYEKNQRPKLLSIRKTGMEIDFYGFTDSQNNFDNQTIENELAKIDDNGARVIRKIESNAPLNSDDRQTLCGFISVMWRRVRKHKKDVNNRAAEIIPTLIEQLKKDAAALYPQVSDENKIRSFESKVEDIQQQYTRQVPDFLFPQHVMSNTAVEKILFDMDWVFIRATPDTQFLTCDNPVVYNKHSGIGDKEKGIILFPLSKNLLLQAMWITAYKNTYIKVKDVDVRRLNQYIVRNADMQVYGSKESKIIASFIIKWINTW